jgi:hypothetical protein
MVTHDLSEGFSLGTRLLVFDKVRIDPHAPGAYGARITYDIPLEQRPPGRRRCLAGQLAGIASHRLEGILDMTDSTATVPALRRRNAPRRRPPFVRAQARPVAAPDGPRGNANVSLTLLNANEKTERLNLPDSLKCQHTAKLTTGHCLYSDMGRVLAAITADTCGWSDSIGGVLCAEEVARKIRPGPLSGTAQRFLPQRHRQPAGGDGQMGAGPVRSADDAQPVQPGQRR